MLSTTTLLAENRAESLCDNYTVDNTIYGLMILLDSPILKDVSMKSRAI
jgi:hypothetical protein